MTSANYEEQIQLANNFCNVGNWKLALETFSALAEKEKNDFRVETGLGYIYYKNNILDKAFVHLSRSLDLNPKQQSLNTILGTILLKSGYGLKAIECFKADINNNYHSAETYLMLGELLSNYGFVADAVKCLEKAIELKPSARAYSNLMHIVHHKQGSTNAEFKKHVEDYYKLFLEPYKKSINVNYEFSKRNKDPNRKIKVGFLSYRFKYKAADFWALKIFENFNKDNIELVLYSDSGFYDDVTHKFKATADSWQEVHTLKTEDLSEQIYNDEVDILVDMIGHMGGGRLELYTLKPAPIQVCWLNYYGTLGMPEMDYFIADNYIVNDEIESYFTEKVYRMPKHFNPFFPKGSLYNAQVNESPFRKNGYITFGSLHRLIKINEDVLNHWSKILNEVPNSKLIMWIPIKKEPEIEEYFIKSFARQGIDTNRITIKEYEEDTEKFFNCFHEFDIHLEAFPFVGGTTTIDAAYMGIPTVTICGNTWTHRCGYATNSLIDSKELITYSLEECKQEVIKLTQDLDRLENYRKTLRSKVEKSPILNHLEYSQDFNNAFRFMWQEYCNQNSNS